MHRPSEDALPHIVESEFGSGKVKGDVSRELIQVGSMLL